MTDESYDGNDRRHRWRFDRKVSFGEIVGIISIIGAVYTKGNAILDEFRVTMTQMDKRVAILEEKALAQKDVDKRQDETIRDGQQRIEAQLMEIQRVLRDQQRSTAK